MIEGREPLDIVEQLREHGARRWGDISAVGVCNDAADEIEMLRAALAASESHAAALEARVAHWKANHDQQVDSKRHTHDLLTSARAEAKEAPE